MSQNFKEKPREFKKDNELQEVGFFSKVIANEKFKAAQEKLIQETLAEHLSEFIKSATYYGSELEFEGPSARAYDKLVIAFRAALQSGVTSASILAHISQKHEGPRMERPLITTLIGVKDALLLASGSLKFTEKSEEEIPKMSLTGQ